MKYFSGPRQINNTLWSKTARKTVPAIPNENPSYIGYTLIKRQEIVHKISVLKISDY
jgi:hypothetical protein